MVMKKLTPIILISMFLVSLLAAGYGSADTVSANTSVNASTSPSASPAASATPSPSASAAASPSPTIVPVKGKLIRREIASEALKKAEDRLKDARQNLEKSKTSYNDAKDQFKKTKSLEDAKAQLTQLIDLMASRLNKIKERVQASKDITEENSNRIVSEIDLKISVLTEWRTKVQAATTKQDLKAIAKEMRTSWTNLNHFARLHELRVELEHFGGIMVQARQLDLKLNNWLSVAAKKNVTIPEKDLKVANFESKLNEAKKNQDAAVTDFKAFRILISNSTGNVTDVEMSQRKALVESIHNNLLAAKKSLKDAREILVGLVRDVVNGLKDKLVTDSSGNPVKVSQSTVLNTSSKIEGIDIETGSSEEARPDL